MDGEESIFEAIRNGDLHSLKMCVEQLSKAEVRRLISTVSENYAVTPLMMACTHGHLAVVEYLIDECGADVDLTESSRDCFILVRGATPLWYASLEGHLNVVRCLLSRGANVNSVAAPGLSALSTACLIGHVEMVRHLVENGADIEANIEAVDRNDHDNNETCLEIACRGQRYQIATYLIQKNVNGRLILKSQRWVAEMFTEMLSEGESVDFEVIMAVFVVVVNDIEAQLKCGEKNEMFKDEVVLHLIGCMARMKPELSEEQNKSFGEVLKRYVSLNRRDKQLDGWTPLHVVCWLHAMGGAEWCPYSVMDVVGLLLDAGADPQAVDPDLNAPLHLLAKARPISLDLIRLLLDRGAHFDARNTYGECFLDRVAPGDRDQLNAFDFTTLQCLAAQSLRKSNIQYQDQLPKSLVSFVKLH